MGSSMHWLQCFVTLLVLFACVASIPESEFGCHGLHPDTNRLGGTGGTYCRVFHLLGDSLQVPVMDEHDGTPWTFMLFADYKALPSLLNMLNRLDQYGYSNFCVIVQDSHTADLLDRLGIPYNAVPSLTAIADATWGPDGYFPQESLPKDHSRRHSPAQYIRQRVLLELLTGGVSVHVVDTDIAYFEDPKRIFRTVPASVPKGPHPRRTTTGSASQARSETAAQTEEPEPLTPLDADVVCEGQRTAWEPREWSHKFGEFWFLLNNGHAFFRATERTKHLMVHWEAKMISEVVHSAGFSQTALGKVLHRRGLTLKLQQSPPCDWRIEQCAQCNWHASGSDKYGLRVVLIPENCNSFHAVANVQLQDGMNEPSNALGPADCRGLPELDDRRFGCGWHQKESLLRQSRDDAWQLPARWRGLAQRGQSFMGPAAWFRNMRWVFEKEKNTTAALIAKTQSNVEDDWVLQGFRVVPASAQKGVGATGATGTSHPWRSCVVSAQRSGHRAIALAGTTCVTASNIDQLEALHLQSAITPHPNSYIDMRNLCPDDSSKLCGCSVSLGSEASGVRWHDGDDSGSGSGSNSGRVPLECMEDDLRFVWKRLWVVYNDTSDQQSEQLAASHGVDTVTVTPGAFSSDRAAPGPMMTTPTATKASNMMMSTRSTLAFEESVRLTLRPTRSDYGGTTADSDDHGIVVGVLTTIDDNRLDELRSLMFVDGQLLTEACTQGFASALIQPLWSPVIATVLIAGDTITLYLSSNGSRKGIKGMDSLIFEAWDSMVILFDAIPVLEFVFKDSESTKETSSWQDWLNRELGPHFGRDTGADPEIVLGKLEMSLSLMPSKPYHICVALMPATSSDGGDDDHQHATLSLPPASLHCTITDNWEIDPIIGDETGSRECRRGFDWNHPERHPNRRYFTLPSVGIDFYDGGWVCVVDTDRENLPLFLNAIMSLQQHCDHLLALATAEDVVPELEKFRIPFVWSAELANETKRAVEQGCQQPAWALQMVSKQVLILELLRAGIPVMISDSDTVHFRSLPRHVDEVNGQSGRVADVDIAVHAFLSFNHSMGIWTAPLSRDCDNAYAYKGGGPCIFTPNNGVAAIRPTRAAIELFTALLRSSQGGRLGWAQVNFVQMIKMGILGTITTSTTSGMQNKDEGRGQASFERVRPNEYLGHHRQYNASILIVTGVHTTNPMYAGWQQYDPVIDPDLVANQADAAAAWEREKAVGSLEDLSQCVLPPIDMEPSLLPVTRSQSPRRHGDDVNASGCDGDGDGDGDGDNNVESYCFLHHACGMAGLNDDKDLANMKAKEAHFHARKRMLVGVNLWSLRSDWHDRVPADGESFDAWLTALRSTSNSATPATTTTTTATASTLL